MKLSDKEWLYLTEILALSPDGGELLERLDKGDFSLSGPDIALIRALVREDDRVFRKYGVSKSWILRLCAGQSAILYQQGDAYQGCRTAKD